MSDIDEEVGSVSDEVKSLIEKEEDFDILKKWHKIAARVGSIDEFMDKVRVHLFNVEINKAVEAGQLK